MSFKAFLSLIMAFLFKFLSLFGISAPAEEPSKPPVIDEPVTKYETVLDVDASTLSIGGCGALFSPLINPLRSEDMVTYCDMGGLYVSHDRGQSWSQKNLNGRLFSMAYDPGNADILYAGGTALYKSTDAGDSFKRVFPRDENIKWSTIKNDYTVTYYFTNLAHYVTTDYMKAILVNPKDSDNVFIVNGNSGSRRTLWESTDGGENFSYVLTYTNNSFSSPYDALQYDKTSNTLQVVTSTAVMKLTDECTLEPLYTSNSRIIQSRLVFENGTPNCILVEKLAEPTEKSVTSLRFTADWQSFTDLTPVLENSGIDLLGHKWKITYMDATSINNIYITQDYTTGSKIAQGVARWNGTKFVWYYGFIKNLDANGKDVNSCENRRGYSLLKNFAWCDGVYYPFGISVDAQNPESALYTTLCGVYYIQDYSHVYQRYSDITYVEGKKKYSSTGIDVQTTYKMVVDPFDENHMLMCTSDLGLVYTYDNGKTWERRMSAGSGTLSKWNNSFYDGWFDTENQNVVYGLWSSRSTKPGFSSTIVNEHGNYGGIAKSTDGGVTWQEFSTGLPADSTPVKLCVIDNPDGGKIMYVVTFNNGVFVSYDMGVTFSEFNDGIEPYRYYYKNGDTIEDKGEYIFTSDIISDGKDVYTMTYYCNYYAYNKDKDKNADDLQSGKVYKLNGNVWQEIPFEFDRPSYISSTRAYVYPKHMALNNGKLYVAVESAHYWLPGEEFVNLSGGIYSSDGTKLTRIISSGTEIENSSHKYENALSYTDCCFDSQGRMYVLDILGNVYTVKDGGELEKIYSEYHQTSSDMQLYDDNTLYVFTLGGGVLKLKLEYRQVEIPA